MLKNRYFGLVMAIALGVIAGGFRVAVADSTDFTYQSLTNLGPCASSRVLLMNNDTNPTCPIQGQGYYDTNETATAVGGTFWWHDDEAKPTGMANFYLQLLSGSTHILYQKTDDEGGKIPLWTLIQCRAGAGGYHASASDNGRRNYLPWSETCQPIDAVLYKAPIEDVVTKLSTTDMSGTKQVAHISMRATAEAVVYSPIYKEGIGEIYFDVVNGWNNLTTPDSICVEIATATLENNEYQDEENLEANKDAENFKDGLEWGKYIWQVIPCDMFVVDELQDVVLPEQNKNLINLVLNPTKYGKKMFYRVRAKLNYQGPIRFRIRRQTSNYTGTGLDYDGLIFIDNIVVSYPGVSAQLSPMGVLAQSDDDSENGGKANIGYVGAFTQPILSRGLEGAMPRMSFSAVTNGQPPWAVAKAEVSKASCAYRWRYLNQSYGPWKTNTVDDITVYDGTNVIWDTAIEVPDKIGDIEYSYSAWVSGTRYKFFDFALDNKLAFPDDSASATFVEAGTNYWSRIREGKSPWQEMHIECLVTTNAEEVLVVTNNWTMELISDNTWRGFVSTPTNYAGKTAHIRFVGKNMWESNGVNPAVKSKTWYFPPGDVTQIPMGAVAVTSVGSSGEQDIVLDATSGYLMFEFNDESGAFTFNRAEYQDFNKWTPQIGQAENKYIGNLVNTSYVGRAKQEYTLDLGEWPMSRSTSKYWWENFDEMAGNKDYPFNVPFTQSEAGKKPDGITPNGWVAEHGMYINGFFSAQTNNNDRGMALQMEGRGLGALALEDSADEPKGIGTINFTARLAQYIDPKDFYCNLGAFTDKNYAFSAKATMTHTPQHNSYLGRNDISTGSPSISMIAYYKPNVGCYEFRVSRVWARSKTEIWDTSTTSANGIMELAIYRWSVDKDDDGNPVWKSKLLNSLRLGGNDKKYNPQLAIGQYYTNGSNKVQYQNYFAPIANSTTPDNDNWSSIYIAAYNTGSGTYIEGAVAGKPVPASGTGDNMLKAAVTNDMASGIMMGLSVVDDEVIVDSVSGGKTLKYHTKGSYGVCSAECPAAFGALSRHSLMQKGPYLSSPKLFVDSELQKNSIDDGDWGSGSLGRILSWKEMYNESKVDYTGKWSFGLCAAPVSQRVYLKTSEINADKDKKDKNWVDSGLSLSLSGYQPTNLVFSPHIITPCNVRLQTGGNSDSLRTDVVIDDVQLSQWAGDSSETSDIGSTEKWAFTDAWIAGTTNDVYQGAGAKVEDAVASVTPCGYYIKQLNDTEFIYVFTNTTKGALGSYATFMPKQDMIVKELFVLGAGGGGGPGGGGGGGGTAIWVTNSVEYTAGEREIKIYVADSASGGDVRYYSNSMTPGAPGNGGHSYVELKNPLKPSSIEKYQGYGGYRGGWFRDDYDKGTGSASGGSAGGGSARKSTVRAAGRAQYAAGFGGAADDGAPGGGGGGGLRGIDPGNGSSYAPANNQAVIWGGTNGWDGIGGAVGGNGGDGFPLSALGDSEIRYAIGELLGDNDAWLGGGGGGGTGINTDANKAKWGTGALTPGAGGRFSGGQGGLYTEFKYSDNKRGGKNGKPFTGGGGGGGTFHNPVTSGSASGSNWILGGGNSGSGLVVMHVKVKDRFAMLQPMRGSETKPMSIRSLFLNGISLLSFSWKDAHKDAVLKVQIATNNVDESNIRQISQSLDNGWVDFGAPIKFSSFSDALRAQGSTNILVGLRAPVSGVIRLLVDPAVVATARKGSTNQLDSMYGTVIITGMKVFDEPELDDRSWWGWNIMPTYKLEWSSLYDPVTLGPGRSCALNFSGSKSDTGVNDPLFADDPDMVYYETHDPFIQTPIFTNRIGAVMFKARVLETNLTKSGWVTISGCANPHVYEDGDTNWEVLTNIEITAATTIFEPYLWRIPTSQSQYQALRLTAFGAAEGRETEGEDSGKPFGSNGTKKQIPVQRVLIDEVVVTQPMAPKLSFKNAYPFRHDTRIGTSIPADRITSSDEQPILGETFGMQVQIVPAGMEDELDKDSIKVYMDWYAGESPWGYNNWKDEKYAKLKVELARAEDWSHGNLVYRSSPTDANAFIPPQQAGEHGYQYVQYRIWAEYSNKNKSPQDPHELTSSEWIRPTWYNGISDPNALNTSFSAYTVLDTISPKRAWFNEINTFDGDTLDANNQYVEVAVPQGFDMSGWTIQAVRSDGSYTTHVVGNFGDNIVAHKTANAVNSYAFIAVQSPRTKAANTHSGLNDGTWRDTAFANGLVDISKPYALSLRRPTGIIEHEVVFMSTNTSTSIVKESYDGTNFLKQLQANMEDHDWVYAGAEAYGALPAYPGKIMSLGVYTNHGEVASCWTNMMQQTPGKVNMTADGIVQYIDPKYFEPPSGTNLWIYANIAEGSINSLSMIIGGVTNTSAVIIVPQGADGSFSTSIVYHVKAWFELDSVVTNEYGKTGVEVPEAKGANGVWELKLNDLKLSDPDSRKFEVTASTRDASQLGKYIDKDDLYYPAIVDWLQGYKEGEIKLAEVWGLNDKPVLDANDETLLLNLREMYWLNISPVANEGGFKNSDWVFKGGMGSGAIPNVATNYTAGGLLTNIRVAVTMMITNRFSNTAHAPNMLRGVEPKSTSYDYDESEEGSDWNSVTFKITGALQNGRVNSIYRPLCWFTLGPDSFKDGFTRVVDVHDPFSSMSPGYSYEWYKHTGCDIWYKWSIDHDTNRPPDTIYQLNDKNALLD